MPEAAGAVLDDIDPCGNDGGTRRGVDGSENLAGRTLSACAKRPRADQEHRASDDANTAAQRVSRCANVGRTLSSLQPRSGSHIRTTEFRRAVDLLGTVDLTPLVTRRFPLRQIDQALDAARGRAGIRILVGPSEHRAGEAAVHR